jgi:muconate cycloisomerase
MEIRRIEVGIVDVPLAGAFATAHSSRTSQKGVVIRVTGQSGDVGWGSVEPTRGYSKSSVDVVAEAVRRCAPSLIGTDALKFRIAQAMMTREGAVPEARAVVEMALLDLAGRALGVPVSAWLGGATRQTFRLNGWIGLVAAAQAATEAADWVQRGFTSAKAKVGHDFQQDVDRVAAIRDATGPAFEIRVDANEGLDVNGSIRLGHALEQYGVSLFEQPVPRHDVVGLAAIRSKIRVPIMADESVEGPESVIELIRREAVDLVKVKVMKQGGLLATLETAQIAAAGGLRVVIGHGFGFWLSTLAEAAVAAACPAIIDGLECVGPLKTRNDVVRTSPPIADGSITLPRTPGLGADADEDRLRALGWKAAVFGDDLA